MGCLPFGEDGALRLYWGGSGVELLFTGPELTVNLETAFAVFEPWIAVEVNGARLLRMPLGRGRSEVCLFRNMDGGLKHIRLWKETQPMAGEFGEFLKLTGLSWTEGEFFQPPRRTRRLEFIGDSLTSGEGVVGARKETAWSSALFSASRTWARETAERLDADFCAVSQSGWGVCTGWDGDPCHAIPAWYEATADLREGEPDAVIVNLGTNDANAIQSGLATGGGALETGAADFLTALRRRYPNAKLVWAYGMAGDPLRPELERAVRRVEGAYYLPLPSVTEETMGSRQHPGPLCHRAAAEVTAEFLTAILDQKG